MAKVTVTENGCTTGSLYQWDRDQVLEISGLPLSVTPEVHFSRSTSGEAIVRPATMDAEGTICAEVPDELLEQAGKLHVYICIKSPDTFCTLFQADVPVRARAMPCSRVEEESEAV